MARYRRRRHPAHQDKTRWARLRRQVFKRDGYRCRRCGKAGRLECDHIKRVEDGGAHWDMANLQTLCRGCHLEKSGSETRRHDPARDAWRALIQERLEESASNT